MKYDDLKHKFSNLIFNNQMFSSIIIESDNIQTLINFGQELSRLLFCENKSLVSDDCSFCKRIKTKNVADFYEIGDFYQVINKQEINQLLNDISTTALEKTLKKIYIINGAENMKSDAANALLKTLEEPPTNTYAILLTQDRSLLLPTIKSRCKTFLISDEFKFDENIFFEIIKSNDRTEFYLASERLKKIDKLELIKMIENTYKHFVVKNKIEIAEETLKLIDDLKFLPIAQAALENYFIILTEKM